MTDQETLHALRKNTRVNDESFRALVDAIRGSAERIIRQMHVYHDETIAALDRLDEGRPRRRKQR